MTAVMMDLLTNWSGSTQSRCNNAKTLLPANAPSASSSCHKHKEKPSKACKFSSTACHDAAAQWSGKWLSVVCLCSVNAACGNSDDTAHTDTQPLRCVIAGERADVKKRAVQRTSEVHQFVPIEQSRILTWLASFQCFMAAASAAMNKSCRSHLSTPRLCLRGQSLASNAIVRTNSYSSCLLWPALAAAAAIWVKAWPPCTLAIFPQFITEASAQFPKNRTATCCVWTLAWSVACSQAGKACGQTDELVSKHIENQVALQFLASPA